MTTNVPEAATKRAAQIAAIHDFADWLAEHPAAPIPWLSLHRHLTDTEMPDHEQLDLVRSVAASLGTGTDESLSDRTVLRHKVNDHVTYELFAWHRDGRGVGELERLRARVAELEAAKPTRLTPEPIAKHYDASASDDASECACGEVFATRELLQQHIAEGNAAGAPECSPACRDLYRPDRGVHFLGCPNFSTPMEVAQPHSSLTCNWCPDPTRPDPDRHPGDGREHREPASAE